MSYAEIVYELRKIGLGYNLDDFLYP